MQDRIESNIRTNFKADPDLRGAAVSESPVSPAAEPQEPTREATSPSKQPIKVTRVTAKAKVQPQQASLPHTLQEPWGHTFGQVLGFTPRYSIRYFSKRFWERLGLRDLGVRSETPGISIICQGGSAVLRSAKCFCFSNHKRSWLKRTTNLHWSKGSELVFSNLTLVFRCVLFSPFEPR